MSISKPDQVGFLRVLRYRRVALVTIQWPLPLMSTPLTVLPPLSMFLPLARRMLLHLLNRTLPSFARPPLLSTARSLTRLTPLTTGMSLTMLCLSMRWRWSQSFASPINTTAMRPAVFVAIAASPSLREMWCGPKGSSWPSRSRLGVVRCRTRPTAAASLLRRQRTTTRKAQRRRRPNAERYRLGVPAFSGVCFCSPKRMT